jgi:hypothetical protein
MASRTVHRVRPGAVRIDLPDATQLTDYSCGAWPSGIPDGEGPRMTPAQSDSAEVLTAYSTR